VSDPNFDNTVVSAMRALSLIERDRRRVTRGYDANEEHGVPTRNRAHLRTLTQTHAQLASDRRHPNGAIGDAGKPVRPDGTAAGVTRFGSRRLHSVFVGRP